MVGGGGNPTTNVKSFEHGATLNKILIPNAPCENATLDRNRSTRTGERNKNALLVRWDRGNTSRIRGGETQLQMSSTSKNRPHHGV
jgi:hypothetical protein